MDERKKSSVEKEIEDEVKNWATDAKKKSPGTEVNNRMDERKKSNIEKDEVKNRGHKKIKIKKIKIKNPPVIK